MNNEPSISYMINFGTVNVWWIHENYKIKTLVSDIQKYKLDIVGLQETHIKGSGIVVLLS